MDLIPRLIEWLPLYGPWLIFALAVLETCFVTGLVVPSGLATSVATVLSRQGAFDLMPFVAAALAGGFVGDSLGFWIGRVTGRHLEEGEGKWAVWFNRQRRRGDRFFGRHPVFSVTVARWVSFVRTVMPMAAGMSDLRYPRYLVYEIPGVVVWVCIYVVLGVAAGESWELAVQAVGVGGAVVFGIAALLLWLVMRRRRSVGGGSLSMLSVALTGNVAAGKSAVARQWKDAGVAVISADELAREAVAPGSPGLAEVRAAFGDDVLTPDGELDRDAMRARVFADPEARARLEAIIHPRVWEARTAWLDARDAEGVELVVSEIPLLFETGREEDFDVTVLVDAPDPERLRRLTELRGLGEDEARAVMAAQMDPERKRDLADIVLVNDADLDALAERADAVLTSLREMASS